MLIISIIVSLLAYLSQLYKIKKEGFSDGISENAFIIPLIINSIMFYKSEAAGIYYLSAQGIIMSLITLWYIKKKRSKGYKNVENKIDFGIAVTAALFMVFGFSQLIKSIKYKGVPNISILTFTLWTSSHIMTYVIAESNEIKIAALISIGLNSLILIDLIYKNRRVKRLITK